MGVDFLLMYEKESRELESLILLQCILESRGFSCKISSTGSYGYWKSFFFYRPQILVVPYMRSNQDLFYFTKFYKWKIKDILNLQIEQIYNQSDIDSGFCRIDGLSKFVHHICWGQNSINQLKSLGVPENRVHLTGSMQFDFYKLDNSGYILNKHQLSELFDLDEHKKWRLFISSFSYCYRTDKKEEMNQYDGLKEFVDISVNSQKEIIGWYFRALNEHSFTDTIFIYRPHPDETISPIVEACAKQFKNFKIISNMPIRHWINSVDYIDTWYSTSILDIMIKGKRCSVLRPIAFPPDLDIDLYRSLPHISNYNDFLFHLVNEDNLQLNYSSAEYYIGSIRDISVLNVASVLISMLHNGANDHIESFYNLRGSFNRNAYNLIGSIMGEVYSIFGFKIGNYFKIRKLITADRVFIGAKTRTIILKSKILKLLQKNNLL